MAPAVLWIDEIEKGLASRGNEDGGTSQRILGSFLTWFQERSAPVFVAATADDISALLPEVEQREEILAIHLDRRDRSPEDFDVPALARTAPLSVTMAERVAELREWARGRAVPAALKLIGSRESSGFQAT
jgi:SpoVK/Ycf46/Vps4 family AAA+-type ATPase